MINRVNNRGNDPRIERLNAKIDQFNQLANNPESNFNQQTTMFKLLEEIDFMGKQLRIQQLDAIATLSPDAGLLGSLIFWEGVTAELGKILPPPSKSLSSELNLINLNKSKPEKKEGTLPSREQWLASNTQGKSIFSRGTISSQSLSVAPQLDALNQVKNRLEKTDKSQIEYFYKLKQLKTTLLNKLTFELTDSIDIVNFRNLIIQVNTEIFYTITANQKLAERFKLHKDCSDMEFVTDLTKSTLVMHRP